MELFIDLKAETVEQEVTLEKENIIIGGSGTVDITENGLKNVKPYEFANVQVPLPEGEIDITENGKVNVYDYETANVNVQPSLIEKSVTQNGEYSASDDEVQGYSKVNVNVPLPSGTKQITENGLVDVYDYASANVNVQPTLIEKSTTENGVFIAADENADGYSKFTVDVPQPSGSVTIDSNGTFDVTPYETAEVNVGEPALTLIDWEGTILKEYSRQQAMALTALPENSGVEHDLLVFQEWNWQLADIKAWLTNHPNASLLVGAIYTTTDGQDHNYCEVEGMTANDDISVRKCATTSFGINYAIRYYRLRNINIPKGTTTIGGNCFNGCFSLRCAVLPTTVTTLGLSAFATNVSLKFISLPHGLITIGQYAMNAASVKNISLPDTVTTIDNQAFSGLYGLEKIEFSRNISSVGTNIFYGATSLKELDLTALQITRIPDGFAYGCNNLKKVTFSKILTTIGINAFYGCNSLVNIDILANITSIESGAFQYAKQVVNVVVRGKPSLSNTSAFTGQAAKRRFFVSRADFSWFETATNWGTLYQDILIIEDNIEYLENEGFNVDEYKEQS